MSKLKNYDICILTGDKDCKKEKPKHINVVDNVLVATHCDICPKWDNYKRKKRKKRCQKD